MSYGASGFTTVSSVKSKVSIAPLSTSPFQEPLSGADGDFSIWAVCRVGETPLPYSNVGLLALRSDETAHVPSISRGVVTISVSRPQCCEVQ